MVGLLVTLRDHERELLAAGLIDKRTAANGARSGFLGCGVFFGRLVHRLAECRALDIRLRGVKLVVSDAHEGLKAAITRVVGATWPNSPCHSSKKRPHP